MFRLFSTTMTRGPNLPLLHHHRRPVGRHHEHAAVIALHPAVEVDAYRRVGSPARRLVRHLADRHVAGVPRHLFAGADPDADDVADGGDRGAVGTIMLRSSVRRRFPGS